MAKILILGAGEMQVQVIQKANRLGLYTIVADMDMQAPGMKYADLPVEASTMDFEKIRAIAIENSINGILTTSDAPVNIVASVSEELNLPSMSTKVAKICTNKYLQRCIFLENGIITPFFELCDKNVNLSKFKNFPYIVKPIDSSASRGVQRVNNREELLKAFEIALSYSREGKILIESFIKGKEFSVETFTQNNRTAVVNITEKLLFGDNLGYFVEDTHIQPARITAQEWSLIENTAKQAIEVVGMNNCPSHTEVKINDKGAYIIEMACRLGGDYITSDLVPLSSGVDMLENLINCSIGKSIDVSKRFKKCSAIQFLNPLNYSKVKSFIEKRSPSIRRFDIKKFENKDIKSSLDRLGYVILQTDSMDEMTLLLKELK